MGHPVYTYMYIRLRKGRGISPLLIPSERKKIILKQTEVYFFIWFRKVTLFGESFLTFALSLTNASRIWITLSLRRLWILVPVHVSRYKICLKSLTSPMKFTSPPDHCEHCESAIKQVYINSTKLKIEPPTNRLKIPPKETAKLLKTN